MKKISVLLPVYNVGGFVEETIESVLEQSYSNFELIVIDDASSDNTALVVSALCQQDSRIKLIINKKNLGISKTLNIGLEESVGQYIARIDGDDLMEKSRLEKQLDFLESNSDYGLVGCWIENIDENGNLIGSSKYPVSHEQAMQCIELCSPVLHVWMASRELYLKLAGYRDTNPAEDYDFLLRTVTSGYRIGNLPYYGTKVRLRDGNTMSVAPLRQRKAFNKLRKMYLNGKINDDLELDLANSSDMQVSSLLSLVHRFSVTCLRRAISSKSILTKCFWAIPSLVSPYTVQDICRRRKFKIIMLNQNSKVDS
ncbi:glycosyltransferase [Vibrio sp. 1262-1]|uniref:glycosyltransferase family 2 protein n=1 Tax=Vibrio sp. 1262-1 TaxID=3074548 RepID=UPI002964E6CA|nr:glycosyltransferase [Vibrio sp. 1262-1]MDW2402513.1 glycosyltransferase [Vibrio sp. 1262-1]